MMIDIKSFDPDSRTVTVAFADGGLTYERQVNACFDETGAYDVAATTDRVNQVALGVSAKMRLGVISAETIAVQTSADVSAPTS